MADNKLPDDITRPQKIDPTKSLQPGEEKPQEAPAKPFSSYMGEKTEGPASTQPSPMDIAKGQVSPTSQPTLESVHAQMTSASSTLGDINSQLQTPNLKLKRSQNYLLRNKLSDANQNIRTAATKVGVDVGKPPQTSGRQNPIMRYMNMVGDSQKQLAEAQNKVNEMSAKGDSVNPAELLTVQIKVNKATQELEYASVLLSNAVSSLKMMFNVQI